MGIKDCGKFNLALLDKWRWRLLTEMDSLWAKVLTMKYLNSSTSKESSWWKDLKKSCSLEGEGGWFESKIQRKVRRGNDVRFWQEVWHNDTRFKDNYPRLYALSTKKNSSIEDMGDWSNGSWS